MVVTGVAHAAAVARQLPALPPTTSLSSRRRATRAPAIGLAAGGDRGAGARPALMGSFAADQLVGRRAGVPGPAVRAAAAGAAEGKADGRSGSRRRGRRPGYGYLRCGAAGSTTATCARSRKFAEKPSAERAAAYLRSGR
jgi:mannose-1-phosphate guanylyltransferase